MTLEAVCPGCGVMGAGCICPIVRPQEMPTLSTWPHEVEQLRAEKQELVMQVLAALGQAEEAYKAQQQAEARVQKLEAFAKECASYTCTCDEAYVGRKMVDPSCMAGEIGYEAQEVLGQPVTCRGILAARSRRTYLQKHKEQ